MFAAGLRRFHLRKPGWGDADFEAYLNKIPRNWRPKVIVHQCHRAVEKYHLGGWHSKDREDQLKSIPLLRQSVPFPTTLSRSIHHLDDLYGDLTSWDYVFLSPVYRSITKADYGPRWERTELEAAIRRCKELSAAKVYALGGVEPANIPDCALMGFDGVALLGAIWSSHHPIRRFREALACMSHLPSECDISQFSTARPNTGAGAGIAGFHARASHRCMPTLQGVDPASPANRHETRSSTRSSTARDEFCETCGLEAISLPILP